MNYAGFYPTNYEDNVGTLASSVFVRDTHFFADTTERDSYFAAHPTELIDDLYVVIGGVMFQYEISSLTWNQFSILVRGERGDDGATGIQGIQGVAGASTYAELTDKITADLPVINTPLFYALAGKQASLVSGINIKTVNNVSLLGSGNIEQVCGSQAFSVGRSAGSGAVTAGNTFGNLNDVYVDHANLNKTTGTFTIPVTGVYQFNVMALKTASTQGLQIALRVNGSATRHTLVIDGVSPYSSYMAAPLTHIANFTAGQNIDVVVQIGTAHGSEEFTFSGFRVA